MKPLEIAFVAVLALVTIIALVIYAVISVGFDEWGDIEGKNNKSVKNQ